MAQNWHIPVDDMQMKKVYSGIDPKWKMLDDKNGLNIKRKHKIPF